MTKLEPAHLEALQVLADTVRVASCVDADDAESLIRVLVETDLPCPKKFQRALGLGRMLVETGKIVPDGHGAHIVFEALGLVARYRKLFDEAFEYAETCTDCK